MINTVFIIVIVIFIITLGLVLKNRRDFAIATRICVAGLIAVTVIAIFPAYYLGYGPCDIGEAVPSSIFSLLYALRVLAGREPLDISYAFVNDYVQYKYIIYPVMLLGPILTAGFIASFFENFIELLRYKLCRKKKMHIFSEINDASISLAESISNKEGRSSAIVFSNTKDSMWRQKQGVRDKVKAIKGIILRCGISELNKPIKVEEIYAYEISENKMLNVDRAISFTNSIKDKWDAKINLFVFASGRSNELLLDNIYRGSDVGNNTVRLRMIDEIKLSCYSMLFATPLYKNINDREEMSLLVIGAGETGLATIKATKWCSQMNRLNCQIHVIDKDAGNIEKILKKECPAESFHEGIYYHNADVRNSDFTDILNECGMVHYVIIATRDDDINIETAVNILELYLKKDISGKHIPIIHTRVRNEEKAVGFEVNPENSEWAKRINTFGSVKKIFNYDNLFNSLLSRMAEKVHLAYYNLIDSPNSEAVNRAMHSYFKKEYNQRSSFAAALHIIYKLFDWGIVVTNGNNLDKSILEEVNRIVEDRGKVSQVAIKEHSRWNTFLQSEGYTTATVEQVKTYYGIVGSHDHKVARLHPAIVEWDELDNVTNELKRIEEKENIDLKKSDFDIVKAIPQIINAALN